MERMLFDYHTHTIYSRHHHGKGTIEENVRAAIRKGLQGIAITDHGPGHLTYGIRRQYLPEMRAEVDRLREKYPEIQIYLGVEANICRSENNLDLIDEDLPWFDFILAGYHYGVLHGSCLANWMMEHGIGSGSKRKEALRRANTEMILGAIRKNRLKILTHPGDKAPVDMQAVAHACAEQGVWMEISTHHRHLTVEEIRIASQEPVQFVISSDAHRPDRVGTYEAGVERARAAGLDLSRIVNIRKEEEIR